MKTLNRPMFKNGGPIKEGIMSGMQEPQAINTVGNNANRDMMGREKHAFFLPFLGANALRAGAMRMAPRAIQGIKNLFGTTKQFQGPVGSFTPGKLVASQMKKPPRIPSSGSYQGVKFTRTPGSTSPSGAPMGEQFVPNFLGRDPTVRLVGGTYKAVTNPRVTGLAGKAARVVFSPTGLVTGAFYAGGKFFDSDGNEIDKKTADEAGLYAGDKVGTSGAPGGGDPGMFLTPKEKKLSTEQKDKLVSDRIEANRKRYYKLMGIDKMNKNAAYDSLIDASKIIQEEGGDLKGSLKSGTLQNRIIQAISGNLDKSADLKKQIDAAILKGEITKDINLSDPTKQADLAYKKVATEKIQKDLSGGSLIDNILVGAKAAGGSNSTSNVYNSVLKTYKTQPIVLADTAETIKLRKGDDYTNDTALVKEIVDAQNKGPGIYIIDKTAVYIDEQGNASTLFQG